MGVSLTAIHFKKIRTSLQPDFRHRHGRPRGGSGCASARRSEASSSTTPPSSAHAATVRACRIPSLVFRSRMSLPHCAPAPPSAVQIPCATFATILRPPPLHAPPSSVPLLRLRLVFAHARGLHLHRLRLCEIVCHHPHPLQLCRMRHRQSSPMVSLLCFHLHLWKDVDPPVVTAFVRTRRNVHLRHHPCLLRRLCVSLLGFIDAESPVVTDIDVCPRQRAVQ